MNDKKGGLGALLAKNKATVGSKRSIDDVENGSGEETSEFIFVDHTAIRLTGRKTLVRQSKQP
jgi:hypothetical protein